MWFLDGPEYYAPPGQQPPRYLTYQNDVRQYVERVAEERHGGVMPALYKQIVALSYQLSQFRCAAGCQAARLQTLDPALSLHCLQQTAPAPALPGGPPHP